MRHEELKKLIELLENSELTEIKVKSLFSQVSLSKNSKSDSGILMNAPPVQPAHMVSALLSETQAFPDSIAEPPVVEENSSNLHEVKSPIVGTYYEGASPDADPFIKVGDHVTEKQTLCIVEAMKIMNEIEADIDGIVKQVLVKNSEPVEYNQPLFLIEP